MKIEIDRHKWIESEKVGYDVGFEFAMIDWNLKHRSGWKHYYMQNHPTSSFKKSG